MKEKINIVLFWINKHKIFLIVVLIGLGLFYWPHIKSVVLYIECREVTEETMNKMFNVEALDYESRKMMHDIILKACIKCRPIAKEKINDMLNEQTLSDEETKIMYEIVFTNCIKEIK